MGIIESWMKRPRPSEETMTDLFSTGAESSLLEVVLYLDDQGDRHAATQLLRAGTVRFYPWPDGEAALDQLERRNARESLASLQDAVVDRYTAADAARLSTALHRLGDVTNATAWSRAAIEEDPCSPEGYLAIARGNLRRFRREDDAVAGLNALRYLTKACQLHPGHGVCLRSLAMLLLLLRGPVAASRVLRPIMRVSPTDPMVLALEALSSIVPPENTSNVQELFLRWETGSSPNHDLSSIGGIPAPEGVDAWELDCSRSLVASSSDADHGDDLIESLSVVVGSVSQATEKMGLGKFLRFTSRGEGGILMGQSESSGMLFSHSRRSSQEPLLYRWMQSDRGRETSR